MKTTQNIKVSEKIIDQVVGQDEAVKIIKKAARQRRHVLLIGDPGTGKSMLGLGLAELLPKSDIKDILAEPNPNDENNPLIKEMEAGTGREEVKKYTLDAKQVFKNNNFLLFIVAIFTLIAPWWVRYYYKSDLMFTAFFLGGMLFLAAFAIMLSMGPRMFKTAGGTIPPKLIVDNFGKKQAPFYDATGAHAGALLGDVLHDPFQSLRGSDKIHCFEGERSLTSRQISEIINRKFSQKGKNILRKREKNYEAISHLKNEFTVLGETNGSASPVEVFSSNRYDHEGEMIKLTTSEGNELTVTPEHKIATFKNKKIKYVEARDVKQGDRVVAKSKNVIISEQDIINTYDKKQREQCKLYYKYKRLKKENPTWGYKRISKAMNEPIHRTRWWHHANSVPVPIETANWLKERGLLPLKSNHSKLRIIAKIIGATFGDGGIFENLNGIFLSSKERYNVKEFGSDLEKLFSLKKEENSRIIKAGVYGNSFCYQNTNRNIIRFFQALGAPVGKKTSQRLIAPSWIHLNKNAESEFFNSLLGSEVGTLKIHVSRKSLNTFDLGITGCKELYENRVAFLLQLKEFLNKNGVKTGKLIAKEIKESDKVLFRLLFSTQFESLINFVENCKLNYCKYKREKLTNTINEFRDEKLMRFNNLIQQGYGAEAAMNLLNLTPRDFYKIANNKYFKVRELKAKYGKT